MNYTIKELEEKTGYGMNWIRANFCRPEFSHIEVLRVSGKNANVVYSNITQKDFDKLDNLRRRKKRESQ